MSGRPKRWLVDSEWTTVRETAGRMGYTDQQFYNQMNRRKCGLPAVVTMIRENQILNGGASGDRHMVDGRWMTIREIAEMLGTTTTALHSWRNGHRKSDGRRPTLQETADAYRRGEVRRGGSKPAQHRVGRKTMTAFEAAERLGVNVNVIRLRMSRKKESLAQVVRYYEKRKIDRAEKAIMDILRGK